MGPKTAAKWINLYDGLDGVIAHADQIKGKAGQSLRDHLDDVMRNRRLNHLLIDLDLGVAPRNDLRITGADRADLARVFEVLEFRTLHQRALRTLTFSDADHAETAEGENSGPLGALKSLGDSVTGPGSSGWGVVSVAGGQPAGSRGRHSPPPWG